MGLPPDRLMSMKANFRMLKLIPLLAILWSVPGLSAHAGGTVPDKRLIGQWHGENQFYGMSRVEITKKKVAIQSVTTALNISADGKVTGHVGGAELSECVVKANRGWIGRMLHLKTDFIIRGKVVGAVAAGSEGGTHTISAPFNLKDHRIAGSMFVIRGPFTYPYPFLKLQLSH